MNNSMFIDIELKEFEIAELFNVKGSKTTSLLELKEKKETEEEYPYVSTKSTNNGVDGFFRYYSELGNVLTVDSATIGYVSYQKNNFSASDHVEILEPIFVMNKYIALFFVQVIFTACNKKYGYGYKFSQRRIKKQKIILPVDDDGNPDYDFMEKYMKEMEKAFIEEYKSYILKNLNILDNVFTNKSSDVNFKDWLEFNISDIFSMERGKRLVKKDRIMGDVPFVTAGHENQGVSDFIGNQDMEKFNNVITIDMFGEAFYRGYSFCCDDNIHVLTEKSPINKFAKQFIVRLINNNNKMFSYGKQYRTKIFKRQKIMLPVDDSGDPDYIFMENYMKKIEYKKITKYLEYIENRV